MATNEILRSSLNKVIITSDIANSDIVKIQTRAFSPNGDVFTIDTRTVSPSFVQTERDVEQLRPELSNVYPYKIVLPKDTDGSTILLSPDIGAPVTASQNYYTPLYYERYNLDVLRLIDRQFTELSSQFAAVGEE